MRIISRLLAFILILLIPLMAMALPAHAATCRTLNDRSICILDIQRSAKNYWEYRAVISTDGVKRPQEIYNCRDRVRIQLNGAIVPFEPNGAGQFICTLFRSNPK